jgi:ABC-type transporter Mla MlaB component
MEKNTKLDLAGDKSVAIESLAGVFYKGKQYYDFKDFNFITNAGLARLIEFLRHKLRNGVDVRFINVNERIQNKIKEMGLEHVLHCNE